METLKPYDPPKTVARENERTGLPPMDGLWLSPLEKLVSIISGVVIIASIIWACIVVVITWMQ